LGFFGADFMIGKQIGFGACDSALDVHMHVHQPIHGHLEPILDFARNELGQFGRVAIEDAMIVDSFGPINGLHQYDVSTIQCAAVVGEYVVCSLRVQKKEKDQ
jgi:hypothetical protein